MGAPSSDDRCQRGRTPIVREDGSVEIPLTRGRVAVVDAIDYPAVAGVRWIANWNADTKSFCARSNSRPRGYMNRTIVRCAPGFVVDHINHDTLDNRRANLRVATRVQNRQNSRKHTPGTSRFKGVHWHSQCKRWQARITPPGGARISLGLYDVEEDAARAYDAAASVAFRDFACLNCG